MKHCHWKKHKPVSVGWRIGPWLMQNGGGSNMAALVLKDNQLVKLAVEYLDAKGQVTTAPVLPVWAASDDTILTMKNISSDGLSAEVLDITVQAGEAVTETIVPGTPVNQQ
jgi:hypothetical protein